ncbi:hypothetical protein [Streptomyces sp. NPDC017964]|uniref:hypothetical protein n=1 Tax=Streptomyces sp. NPDC017964 TaxID=3365022 RepID=UPI00379F27C5
MLALLNALGFKYNNTAYRPVMDAMKLLKKYADVDGKTRFYDATDAVPMDGGVHKDWREAVVDAMSSASRTSCTSWSRCGTRSVCGHHLASYGSQRPKTGVLCQRTVTACHWTWTTSGLVPPDVEQRGSQWHFDAQCFCS